MHKMTSSRPYLIRALYEWIVENDMTPYIVVDALVEGIVVPTQHVREGQIVLNISPRAINHLRLSNDEVAFSARFGGAEMQVSLPPRAVVAIYARENGEGMMFREEGGGDAPPDGPHTPGDTPVKPKLKVVK